SCGSCLSWQCSSGVVQRPILDLDAGGAKVREHGVDAALVDGAQAVAGHAQLHPAILARHPEPAIVQVGLERAPGLVVGVGYVVTGHRFLAGDLTDSGHDVLSDSRGLDMRKSGALYQIRPRFASTRSTPRPAPPATRIRRCR